MAEEKDKNKKFRVYIKGHEAVILYPALVTPCLVEQGGCMTVILATKESFYDEYQKEPKEGENGIGPLTARKMHSQLALVPWDNAAIFNTHEVQYIGSKRQLIATQNMIYSSHIAAVQKHVSKDYRGWYLGELELEKSEKGEGVIVETAKDCFVQGYDELSEKKPLGVLHQGAVKMYLDRGYKHLFQLNFKNFDKSNTQGMYELAFIYFELYDDSKLASEEASVPGSQPPDDDSHDGSVEENGKALPCCHTDPDDDVVNDYFEKNNLKQRPVLIRTAEPITADKTVGGKKMFRLYGKDFTTTEGGPMLQSRHPVYIPEEWKGRIGVVGDLHVSSRQTLYSKAKPQVIPGVDDKESPVVSGIAHVSINSASKLMKEIASKSDVLTIVGDLYDHTRNCDPDYFRGENEIKNTGKLWNALGYKDNYKGNYNAYPRGIDGLLMLSRILSLYREEKKPVIYINGNHEAYEHPYGISPRAFRNLVTGATYIKANTVVAADHNLTFYEACLLYGKEYHEVGSATNFNYFNFYWLYCLYTPWKDFNITYASKKQSYNFVCLGWGDLEHFYASGIVRGGGFLPRAGEACTKDQVALASWAAKKPGKKILLTHFTFVCYDQPIALNDKSACVYTKTGLIDQNTLTLYDIGSFYEEREAMYELLGSGQINYSICGHSHRAGAYACMGGPGMKVTLGTIGAPQIAVSPEDGPTDAIPNIHNLMHYKILVCGAAGPYSYQNLAGELGGFGMDCPQGFILDAHNDSLTWVKDSVCVETRKPRLAVVMDYLWYVGKCRPFCAYQKSDYESGIRQDYDGTFYFQLSNEFKNLFISENNVTTDRWGRKIPIIGHPFAEIALIAVGTDDIAILYMYPSASESTNTKRVHQFPMFSLTLDKGGLDAFKRKKTLSGDIIAHFFSIKFNSVPGVIDKNLYDFEKAWCFPVTIEGDYKRIYRPSQDVGGEVPNHDFYSQKWPEEYKNSNTK